MIAIEAISYYGIGQDRLYADAVVKLVSYEPISVMRYISILPEELTGDVTDNVQADIIPLTNGIDIDTLDWKMMLDYEGLTVAKPLESQKLTGVEGNITVMLDKAVIAAKGKHNLLLAQLSLVEPLRKNVIDKQRNI